MNLATFSQFQVYAFGLATVLLVLYVVVPVLLSLFGKEIPAEGILMWHKVRLAILIITVLIVGVGVGRQAFQNQVPNVDLPDGRQGVTDRVNAFERKELK